MPCSVNAPVLTLSRLQRMHDAAVAILDRTGLRVEHEEIAGAVARRPGFRAAGGRIRIDPAIAEATLQRIRADARAVPPVSPPPDPAAPSPILLSADDRATWIVEPGGRELRPLLLSDVVEGARLLRALAPEGVRGATPGFPTDVPEPMRPIEQYLVAAEYSLDGGASSQVADIPTARALLDMDSVYGRRPWLSVHLTNPLVLAGNELEIAWALRDRVDGLTFGAMPIMGLSGPCDPIAVFTLAMAECLGGAAILGALLPEHRLAAGPHPEPADLASGAIVFGSCEWQTLDLMHRDAFAFYGRRLNRKLLLTSASLPGPQAQAERMASVCFGLDSGYDHFHNIGQLGLDEVWSPAQCILDLDLVDEARRATPGLDAPAEGLDLARLPDVVDDVVLRHGGVFAIHETTLNNMRAVYHRPRALLRLTRARWQADGRPSPVREADARAREAAASLDIEPPRDILRELHKISDRFRESLR